MEFFERELFIGQDVDGVHIVHHAYITSPTESGPLFVTHHGAGSCGLSFAACAAEIRKILPSAGVLSLDARNHGRTSQTRSEGQGGDAGNTNIPLDLSLETLGRDLVYVVSRAKIEMNWESMPSLVLVGHSLGGAVITDVAKKGDLGSNVLAYAVLDVVEGMDILKLLIGARLLNGSPQVPPWTRCKTWKRTSLQGLQGSHHLLRGLSGSKYQINDPRNRSLLTYIS